MAKISKKQNFKNLEELKQEVKDTVWAGGDYIKVGGVDYVMVEYSMGDIKDYKGSGKTMSKDVVYADEDTLTKEIFIDRSNDDVYEDSSGIDWTFKGYQPRIKASKGKDIDLSDININQLYIDIESVLTQYVLFNEWEIDDKTIIKFLEQDNVYNILEPYLHKAKHEINKLSKEFVKEIVNNQKEKNK